MRTRPRPRGGVCISGALSRPRAARLLRAGRGVALQLLVLHARVLTERGRACNISNRTLQAMNKHALGRLARNVTIVRLTLVVGWLAMVAVLAVFAVILDGHVS